MSKLTNTKRAYDKIASLIDQEIRARRGSVKELEEFRKTLDVAFYLLGWGQFEYLVRREAADVVEQHSRSKTVDGHAWRQVKGNIKSLTVRTQLDIIFHTDSKLRGELDEDYTVRNEAAHDNQMPKDAKDVSAWLEKLEEAIEKIQG